MTQPLLLWCPKLKIQMYLICCRPHSLVVLVSGHTASGQYRCEVSIEKSFLTMKSSKNVTVVGGSREMEILKVNKFKLYSSSPSVSSHYHRRKRVLQWGEEILIHVPRHQNLEKSISYHSEQLYLDHYSKF